MANNSRIESLAPELLNAVFDKLDADFSSEAQAIGFVSQCVNTDTKHEGDLLYLNRLRTFRSLCSTSRCLRSAATPYLYRDFRSRGTGRDMLLFARSLHEDRRLPKLVRYVEIGSSMHMSAPTLPAVALDVLVRPNGLPELVKAYPMRLELAAGLKVGCHTAAAIYLLAMVTSVNSVSVDLRSVRSETEGQIGFTKGVCCPDLSVGLSAIIAAGGLQSTFSTLKNVTLKGKSCAWRQVGDSANTMLPFLGLPALKELHCSGLASMVEVQAADHFDLSGCLSGVETLRLHSCYLGERHMIDLVEHCKALRTLDVEWCAYDDDTLEPQRPAPSGPRTDLMIDQAKLVAALAKHAATLENVALRALDQGGQVFDGPPGDWSGFHALRKLEVDEWVLHAYPAWTGAVLTLPPGLSDLTIHSYSNFEDIGDILSALSNVHLDSLVWLRLTFEGSQDEWSDTQRKTSIDVSSRDGSTSSTYDYHWNMIWGGPDDAINFAACGNPRGYPVWPLCGFLARNIVDYGMESIFSEPAEDDDPDAEQSESDGE